MYSRGKATALNTREPLAIRHSWPLYDAAQHFELGCILNSAITDVLEPEETGHVGLHHAGLWECNLADNSLIWSGGVYDIFGLPRGLHVTRDETVALYCEESRAAMERLRAYAIKHRRGFTLDTTVRPIGGGTRQMRLVAAPVVEEGHVVRLHGLKLIL